MFFPLDQTISPMCYTQETQSIRLGQATDAQDGSDCQEAREVGALCPKNMDG